ncbi:SDR family NAD(P)-dependent oxidoreductase [Spirosoma horti]
MNLQNNTVLITGGGSGIGFETARKFSALGNKVIIVGRNDQKLAAAAAQLNNVTAIQCDVTDERDLDRLVDRIKADFSSLNLLVNNSGSAHQFSLASGSDVYEGAKKEMEINYLAPLRLIDKLLPVLQEQPESAIVNVTSVVAIVPWAVMPTYSASKVALQFYTRLLRLSLAQSPVKVFEVFPPLTDTDFARTIPIEKMSPATVADAILKGIEQDLPEIRIGLADYFFTINKESSEKAFSLLNGN